VTITATPGLGNATEESPAREDVDNVPFVIDEVLVEVPFWGHTTFAWAEKITYICIKIYAYSYIFFYILGIYYCKGKCVC
jgi:hypothetical protein